MKLNELIPMKRQPSPSASSFDNNDSVDEESKKESPKRPAPKNLKVIVDHKNTIKSNAPNSSNLKPAASSASSQ